MRAALNLKNADSPCVDGSMQGTSSQWLVSLFLTGRLLAAGGLSHFVQSVTDVCQIGTCTSHALEEVRGGWGARVAGLPVASIDVVLIICEGWCIRTCSTEPYSDIILHISSLQSLVALELQREAI